VPLLAKFAKEVFVPIDDSEDDLLYRVVRNEEEQYSIWPADRENPLGWFDVGKSGAKTDCLDYIKQVWTDITPLNVRRQLARQRG
jgi:MbtH protein